MVDAQLRPVVDTNHSESRKSYWAALGLLALGAFIGSWFSPWVRSIGISGNFRGSVDELRYIFSHANYAPATGSLAVWVLPFALFLLGGASLWARTRLAVGAGVAAAVAVVAILVASSGRVGPDAHAILFSTPQEPFTWESRLEPTGWLAIGASTLLLLLTAVHLASRPWARATDASPR